MMDYTKRNYLPREVKCLVNNSQVIYTNKDYLYLYYTTLNTQLPPSDALNKYPIVIEEELNDINDTDNLITNYIISTYNKYQSASKYVTSFANILTFNNTIKDLTPNVFNTINLVNIEFKQYKLHDLRAPTNEPSPNKILVYDLNNISPTFCGSFLEAMLSHILNCDESYNIDDILTSPDDNTTSFELKTILSKYVNNLITITDNIYVNDQLLNISHFKNIYYSFVWLALKHFMKRTLKPDDYIAANNFINYIDNHLELLNSYYNTLKSCNFIKQLIKSKLKHGEHCDGKINGIHLTGETDFSNDRYIVDAKCYKVDHPEQWYYQLELYRRLLNRNSSLYIINFMNNKVFEF